MTRQPREPLSAEEAALAARLESFQGLAEPGPGVDARILAAARVAAATPAATGRRIRWLAPVAVAASLSLAVGLAWRLQPAGVPVADSPSATMATPQEAQITAPPREAPAPRSPPPPQPDPVVKAASRASAAPPSAMEEPASPAPPPPAVAPALESSPADSAVAKASPPSSPPVAQSPAAADGVRERASTAGTTQVVRPNEAARAAQVGTLETGAYPDDPGEEVPPATVDSPEVRQAWLRRIGELLQEGRMDEARASLAEFRRRYPDAPLPPDLRALEP